jgi:outer membrane autotransporter protein
VGTLTIVGDFTQTGGSFEVEFDENGLDLLDVTGAATLASDPTLTIIALDGVTSASGVILHAAGGITGNFGEVIYEGNGAAVLDYDVEDITLTVVDGTPILAASAASLATAFDFMEHAGADRNDPCQPDGRELVAASECDGRLWLKGFGRRASDEGSSHRAFDHNAAGLALGGDKLIGAMTRMGASVGAAFTDERVEQDAADAKIRSLLATLYVTHDRGPSFFTASLLGGRQDMDLSRLALSNGTVVSADASPSGLVAGVSLEAGIDLRLRENLTLTPSLWASYLHQWVGSYEEEGADAMNLDVAAYDSGALRGKGELKASYEALLGTSLVSPYVKLGAVVDVPLGGEVDASLATGEDFNLSLDEERRVSGLVGLGLDVSWSPRARGYLAYEGELSETASVQTLSAGIRVLW